MSDRRCPKCERVLPLTIKHWHRGGDGFQGYCRDCNIAIATTFALRRQAEQKEWRAEVEAMVVNAQRIAATERRAYVALDLITSAWVRFRLRRWTDRGAAAA